MRGVRKRAPIPYRADLKLGELDDAVDEVLSIIRELSVPGLKGIQDEAAYRSESPVTDQAALWEGIARATQHKLDVRQARERKGGTWVAVANYRYWENKELGEGRLSRVGHVECRGREAAIKAGRKLLMPEVEGRAGKR